MRITEQEKIHAAAVTYQQQRFTLKIKYLFTHTHTISHFILNQETTCLYPDLVLVIAKFSFLIT